MIIFLLLIIIFLQLVTLTSLKTMLYITFLITIICAMVIWAWFLISKLK